MTSRGRLFHSLRHGLIAKQGTRGYRSLSALLAAEPMFLWRGEFLAGPCCLTYKATTQIFNTIPTTPLPILLSSLLSPPIHQTLSNFNYPTTTFTIAIE